MTPKLTVGVIQKIVDGEEVTESPVLQLVELFQLSGDTDMFQVILSDGETFLPNCVLDSKLHPLVPCLDKLAILRLNNFSFRNHDPARSFLSVTDITILQSGSEVGERIFIYPDSQLSETADNTGSVASEVWQPSSDDSFTPSLHPDVLTTPVQPVTSERQTPVLAAPVQSLTSERQTPVLSSPVQPPTSERHNPVLAAPVQPPAPPSVTEGPSPMLPASIQPPTTERQTLPIFCLNPYQSKWTILGRVMSKTPVYHWNNPRGQGHMFSMVLADQTGQICATAFMAECDYFYDTITVDHAYYISQAVVKASNQRFDTTSHMYELRFTSATVVEPCSTPTAPLPHLAFSPTPFNQLDQLGNDALVDVAGICVAAAPLETVEHRGQQLKRRQVWLVDRTISQVTLSLWGQQAEEFDDSTNPVLIIKNARLLEYNGWNLKLCGSSWLQVDPDTKEARDLKEWFSLEDLQLPDFDATQEYIVAPSQNS